MEKKNVEKLQKAVELLKKNIEINNKNREIIYEELLTPEIREMLAVIIDADRCAYEHRINKDSWIRLDGIKICYCTNTGIVDALDSPGYYYENSNNSIKSIESAATRVVNISYYIKTINELSLDIINGITDRYKEITERQSNALDFILKNLGADIDPITHIKVTVEWVEEE